ncbi:MAG: PAS domain-containing protein, partial [Clostridiales bacterium]|nr:PAS domain-containing protein [Clostridiales bacterium]
MTYKDDLEKLRKEAGFDVNDPTSFARGKPGKPLSEDPSSKALSDGASGSASGDGKRSPTGAFTSEEKKMTLWQRISLPFIRNSFLSVLFFMLLTVIWIVMSHTILASIRNVPRSTLIIFMIKDSAYMIILGTIMYRIFIKQFANTYHLEEDYRKEFDRAEQWKAIQHSMMETMPETLVYTLDRDFRYTSFNNRHKYSMLRIWHEEIKVGDCLLDHITDDEIRGLIRRDLENALKGEYFSQVNQFGENDQTAVYWQNYYAPILDEKKKIIGVSCFATNITSLKQSQNKNLFLSYHDPLTQLYNRIYCEGEFDRAEAEEIT